MSPASEAGGLIDYSYIRRFNGRRALLHYFDTRGGTNQSCHQGVIQFLATKHAVD